jgi:hypothetical protein
VLFIDGGHGKVALMGMHTLDGNQTEDLLQVTSAGNFLLQEV